MKKVEAASCRLAVLSPNDLHDFKAPSPACKRLETRMIELRWWAVAQRRRTVAPADAAGCRVYRERILRAMSIYERITGNLSDSVCYRSEQVWQYVSLSRLTRAFDQDAGHGRRSTWGSAAFVSHVNRRTNRLTGARVRLESLTYKNCEQMSMYGRISGNSRHSARGADAQEWVGSPRNQTVGRCHRGRAQWPVAGTEKNCAP